jgi:hypothetical protein
MSRFRGKINLDMIHSINSYYSPHYARGLTYIHRYMIE